MATNTLSTRIALRNSLAADWTTKNPVLLRGEIGIEIDTKRFKIGDGVKTWKELDYAVPTLAEVGGITGIGDKTDVNLYPTIDSNVSGQTANLGVLISGKDGNRLKAVEGGLLVEAASVAQGTKADSALQELRSLCGAIDVQKLGSGVATITPYVSPDTNNILSINCDRFTDPETGTSYPGENAGFFVPRNHEHYTSEVTALTGYLKPQATSSLTTKDTLNEALGKLEKALDGKEATFTKNTAFNKNFSNSAGATPTTSGAAGTATTVSRSDHSHPLQTTITGNAATATKLTTARTINGVDFDGSANITITADPNSHNQPSNTINVMTGYAKAAAASAIATTDSLNTAIGKLEKSLDSKVSTNSSITAGTATKITYDAKGLVTAGGSLTAADIPSLTLAKISNAGTAAAKNEDYFILASHKGVASGVATLDASGLIPSSQLPSYVDDVIEAASLAALNALPAASKTTGKIYVAIDTGTVYRWSGSTFVSISNPLDLATTTEAQTGTNTTKAMSPARTKESIAQWVTTSTNGKISVAGTAISVYAHPNHTGDVTSTGDGATTIATGAVTTAKIADKNVTNAKILSMDANKLTQIEGDYLILNCGGA